MYYNQEKADKIVAEINQREGVPKTAGNTAKLASVRTHPNKEKYAISVGHLTHREYIDELFAQERVEELSEDWFEDEIE